VSIESVRSFKFRTHQRSISARFYCSTILPTRRCRKKQPPFSHKLISMTDHTTQTLSESLRAPYCNGMLHPHPPAPVSLLSSRTLYLTSQQFEAHANPFKLTHSLVECCSRSTPQLLLHQHINIAYPTQSNHLTNTWTTQQQHTLTDGHVTFTYGTPSAIAS
jgi:hypothetical protein